jgi:rubrerythrin
MFEQAQLAQRFQSLLAQERDAEKAYADLAAEVSDPRLRAEVEQLRREKRRHAELARRLLEIVE